MNKSNSKFRITGDDLMEINRDLSSKLGLTKKTQSPVHAELESPFFRGKLEIHNPRRGLYLYSLDLYIDRDIEILVTMKHPMAIATLVLSGACRQRIQRPNRHESIIEFNTGQNVICTFQAERSRFDLAGGHSHRLVDLHIDPTVFSDQVGSGEIELREPLKSILFKTEESRSSAQIFLPQCLEDIANQILNCPLRGLPRQLFMESKALEILALELDIFSQSKPSGVNHSKQDMKRLELARQILEREFDDPPSLIQLARRVGLNDFKLKRGFRQVYHTTVYGYVRRRRMEKARALLETGGLNVTEVATTTGYSCLGHFSAAFKKHFGLLPSAVLSKPPSSAHGQSGYSSDMPGDTMPDESDSRFKDLY